MQATTTLQRLNGIVAGATQREQRSLVQNARILSRLPCPEVIEERNRMAREIHDTLAQQFAGIFLHLETANSLLNAEQQDISEYVTRAKELAKCGLEDGCGNRHELWSAWRLRRYEGRNSTRRG
jgi:signal transduction histidine kinase